MLELGFGNKSVLYSRLLHPQHLDGIWSGLIWYRLPLDILVSIQNLDPEKFQEVRE